MDFWSPLSAVMILSLIGCHYDKTGNCCEIRRFDNSLMIVS